jgi:hypothetical protein
MVRLRIHAADRALAHGADIITGCTPAEIDDSIVAMSGSGHTEESVVCLAGSALAVHRRHARLRDRPSRSAPSVLLAAGMAAIVPTIT